jgi:hypothetical protein
MKSNNLYKLKKYQNSLLNSLINDKIFEKQGENARNKALTSYRTIQNSLIIVNSYFIYIFPCSTKLLLKGIRPSSAYTTVLEE